VQSPSLTSNVRTFRNAMTRDDITAVVARRQKAIDNHDAASFAAEYAEDCVVESPMAGTLQGRAAVEESTRNWFSAFPDAKVHIESVMVDADQVALVLRIEGTDTGGFLKLPPTGMFFSIPGVFLSQLKGSQIVRERRSYDFGKFLLRLARELGTAIESAQLYRETLERARLERDIKVAAGIQRELLPQGRYVRPGFEVAAASVRCRAVGGDFFDYFELSDGAVGLALGDVAGKGPPAALLTAVFQGILRVHTQSNESPAQTLKHVNDTLVRRTIQSRFVTAMYAVLWHDGRMTYCNAGHNAPVLVGRRRTRRLHVGGLILGAFEHAAFDEETLQLEPADVLVVFSDGITETRNVHGEEYGDERLISCVGASRELRPDALVERLLASVCEFSDGAPQSDDLTALVLRYEGAP
jgi:steroid delta-isomerase-like uncharacterized protein